MLQHLVNGITLGIIYSLLALGYSMVFGVLSFINFSHGHVSATGAYVSWYCIIMGIPIGLSFLIGIVSSIILGMSFERIGYRPIRNSHKLYMLIVSLGFSYIVSTGIQVLWGTDARSMTVIKNIQSIHMGNVMLNSIQVGTILLAIVIMISLTLIIKKTKIGTGIRAVSLDRSTAELMGVNVDRVISLTFAIGSGLGAISAIMFGLCYSSIYPMMGEVIGTKAFVAVVLGGIGSIPGAMLGGLLIGILETMAGVFLNAQLRDAIAFIILILILICKPSGLLVKEVVKE